MYPQSSSHPLGVGPKLVNLSQGVKSAPVNALPVIVFLDEFEALLALPVVHLSTREEIEGEVFL